MFAKHPEIAKRWAHEGKISKRRAKRRKK